MAIPQSEIRSASTPSALSARSGVKTATNFAEAKANRLETAFLCHSHKDRELAEKTQAFLVSKGWAVYIDWQDASMPETPNRETAVRIQDRIRNCDWFLFLATANSMASRWCPWELGFSDGAKGKDTIIVIPTIDSHGVSYGNEYMQLYRRIDYTAGSIRSIKRMEPGYAMTGVDLSAL